MSFVTEYQRNFTSMGGIRFERKVLNCLQRIIPKNQCHCVLKLYDQKSFKKSFKLYISVFYLLPACVCICSYLHRIYMCICIYVYVQSLFTHVSPQFSNIFYVFCGNSSLVQLTKSAPLDSDLLHLEHSRKYLTANHLQPVCFTAKLVTVIHHYFLNVPDAGQSASPP